MKRHRPALTLPALALLANASMATFPTAGVAGEDAQTEQGARRIELRVQRNRQPINLDTTAPGQRGD